MGFISWLTEKVVKPVAGYLSTDADERATSANTAAAMAAILKRQYDDGLISAEEYQRRAAEIGEMADLTRTVGGAVIDRVPSAIVESVEELPERINKAVDAVGKGFWASIPVWLRWLIGGAVVAYLFILIRPYLPTPAKASATTKKRRK